MQTGQAGGTSLFLYAYIWSLRAVSISMHSKSIMRNGTPILHPPWACCWLLRGSTEIDNPLQEGVLPVLIKHSAVLSRYHSRGRGYTWSARIRAQSAHDKPAFPLRECAP